MRWLLRRIRRLFSRRRIGHAPQVSKMPQVMWRGTDSYWREVASARNEILDDVPWKEGE